MPRPCCPCKRGREVFRINGELQVCACPCDHTVATGEKTIARVAKGVCTRCGSNPPKPGKRCCPGCIALQAKYAATRIADDKRLDRIGREAVGLAVRS